MLGLSNPSAKDWRESVVGKEISDESAAKFLSLKKRFSEKKHNGKKASRGESRMVAGKFGTIIYTQFGRKRRDWAWDRKAAKKLTERALP